MQLWIVLWGVLVVMVAAPVVADHVRARGRSVGQAEAEWDSVTAGLLFGGPGRAVDAAITDMVAQGSLVPNERGNLRAAPNASARPGDPVTQAVLRATRVIPTPVAKLREIVVKNLEGHLRKRYTHLRDAGLVWKNGAWAAVAPVVYSVTCVITAFLVTMVVSGVTTDYLDTHLVTAGPWSWVAVLAGLGFAAAVTLGRDGVSSPDPRTTLGHACGRLLVRRAADKPGLVVAVLGLGAVEVDKAAKSALGAATHDTGWAPRPGRMSLPSARLARELTRHIKPTAT
ncbi:TIGR04222 domain-containing membrane protein [Actinokineospora sp. 24-640]